ncbi:MAG: N-acetyl-gamma-glutamyl-phosphate reductase [Muribaculaceae bacterium]|nr:N-acetyl-gamma-glutamyl-phosphate reductase [Muribaculaceae bacterium]
MIRAGIIGGEAYTAGELLRLLINHPDVEISWVNSPAHVGDLITDVHQGLLGETYLRFIDDAPWDSIDVLFCCMPHGQVRPFLQQHPVPDYVKIIDLSRDHRLPDEENEHDFVYGLPELNRKAMVRGAKHVANPGAFATAIELALLPLAKNQLIHSDIHVTAIGGSTFEDVNTLTQTNFSMRNNNITLYKPFRHQQTDEIDQTLTTLQPDFDNDIILVTLRGCFARGIMVVAYLDMPNDLDEIRAIYEEAYSDHNFTFLADRQPDLKDVVNTNKCIIHLQKIDGRLLVTAVIDNLLKGGSGTAVHNMNLLFGLSERTGLSLKPTAF